MENKNTKYVILHQFLMALSLTLALVMIDAPIWLTFIVTFLIFSPWIFGSVKLATVIYSAYDIIRPILYIWALVVTVQGKQDFFAIAFYILMGLQAINIIKRFIGTILGIMIAFTKKNK